MACGNHGDDLLFEKDGIGAATSDVCCCEGEGCNDESFALSCNNKVLSSSITTLEQTLGYVALGFFVCICLTIANALLSRGKNAKKDTSQSASPFVIST